TPTIETGSRRRGGSWRSRRCGRLDFLPNCTFTLEQTKCCTGNLDSVIPLQQRLQRENLPRGKSRFERCTQLSTHRALTIPRGSSCIRKSEGLHLAARHPSELGNFPGLNHRD